MPAYREPEDKKIGRVRAHAVTLDNRERAVITGVQDVDSFNETEVMLISDVGPITVVGRDLHVSKLNLDEGQLIIEGVIVAVEYCEDKIRDKHTSVLARIFK
jgi:sporulation protein YabP